MRCWCRCAVAQVGVAAWALRPLNSDMGLSFGWPVSDWLQVKPKGEPKPVFEGPHPFDTKLGLPPLLGPGPPNPQTKTGGVWGGAILRAWVIMRSLKIEGAPFALFFHDVKGEPTRTPKTEPKRNKMQINHV